MLQNLGNQNSNILCTPPSEDEAKTLQREIDLLDERTTNVENDISDLTERLDNDECRICCNECHINDLYECLAEISPDLSCLTERVCTNEEDIADLKTCPGINCTGTLVQSDIVDFATCQKVHEIINACGYTTCIGTLIETDLDPLRTNISNLQSCPGLNCVGDVTQDDIASLVDCTCVKEIINACGYTTCTGTLTDSDLDPLRESIATLDSCPGLNCTGTLVDSDLDPIRSDIQDLQSCPGLNCIGTIVQSDIENFITMQDVDACGYTTCTGTLVDSDLDPLRTDINCLQNCPGLDCTGTLTEQDIADMETQTHAASTYATITCVDTEKARIDNLESCPGLDCVGTLVASDIADMETQTHASATYATQSCVDDVKSRVCTNEGNIAQLQSCPGLDCIGTLVESDLDDYATKVCVHNIIDSCGYATKACVCTIIDACCYATQSCVDDVKSRVCTNEGCITSLNSCAGLNCTGTVTSVNNVSPVNGNVTLVIPPDLSDQVTCNKNDIAAIKEKIPDAASSANQLADKNWVNSSIETSTATFVGTYDDVACLPTTGVDNNDYAFVTSCDPQTGTISYTRYKYSDYTSSWSCEYTINTSGFTADQLAALNSGITCELVDKITDVYDSTVTLCFNGQCKGSFNLNQSVDSCIDLGNTIACATNATCFGGCTYSQAKTDIRDGLVTQACLDACGYTTCTGTLVPSDLDDINTDIANLKSCAGLDCTGTVSSISLNGNSFTVNNGAATLTGFKPDTAVLADCATLVKRTATSINANCSLALLSGCTTADGVSIFVDSDNHVTYNPSTNTLITCNLVLSCSTCPVKTKSVNSYTWTGSTRCTAWDICCFLKCATLTATPTPSIIKFSWNDAQNNCVCWGTDKVFSLSGGYVEVVGTVGENLWDDTCSGWYTADVILHPRVGSPIRFIACKGSSTPRVATIICEAHDSCNSCYADNAACFNGCTYSQACADIRDGLVTSTDLASCGYTTCIGTVTNVDTGANADVPVTLSTDTTSVGTSTCCPLTFNPATGNLVAPSVNNCKYITKSVGTCADWKSKYYLIFERTVSATSYSQPLCLCGNIGNYSSAVKNPFEITIDFRATNTPVRGYVCGTDSGTNNCWNIIPTWDADTNTARVYVWLGSGNYNAFWINTSCACYTPATYNCPLTEISGTQNCCGFWNLLRCTNATCWNGCTYGSVIKTATWSISSNTINYTE